MSQVKAAMVAEARQQPGQKILESVPFFGPVRVALLLAIIAAPFRFRGKRQLWPDVGLAVVTRASADQEMVNGKLRRRKKGSADVIRDGFGRPSSLGLESTAVSVAGTPVVHRPHTG